MPLFLGIDVGTTNIAVLALDAHSGSVRALSIVRNDSEVTSEEAKARGWSEWDAEKTVKLVFKAVAAVISKVDPNSIESIGVTGQMHGVVLVSDEGRPLTPFIGWMDRRCDEIIPETGTSYIECMIEMAGKNGFSREGCIPATGYMGSTLFWMKKNRSLPKAPATACFLPDYVVMRLTGEGPFTDPTIACSSGLFDIVYKRWDASLIRRLGLQEVSFPEVKRSGDIAGLLTEEAAEETGLPAGIPVSVACGDNQACFLGSVAEKERSVLINIGTGGQVSLWTSSYMQVSGAETRCYVDEGYLLVGADTCGGGSYALLHDFFLEVGRVFFGIKSEKSLYDEMMRQASKVPFGSDGLRCKPFFDGSRLDPSRRASWLGLNRFNFTPAHMTRSLLEGIAYHFKTLYDNMISEGVPAREILVGSGNGIRRNKLLAEILSKIFNMPLNIPVKTEEAALGAAVLAASGIGEIALEEAAELIRYKRIKE